MPGILLERGGASRPIGLDLRKHFGNLESMPSKKKPDEGKSSRHRVAKRAPHAPMLTLFYGDEEDSSSNGQHNEQPTRKNPETDEEREKRLAKREALTLQAFTIAYENHHPRKSS